MARGKSTRDGVASAPGELALVQAFANTAASGKKREELGSPAELRRWLEHRGLLDDGSQLSHEDHASVLRARRSIRSLLAANNGGEREPAAVDQLDEALAGTRFELRVDAGGPARFEPVSAGVKAALGRLLAIVAAARAAGTWRRLRACADPECRTAFFANSKRARWCTERCGARVRARTRRRSRRSRGR